MIARRGPCDRYEDALVRVAGWIAEHNEEFVSANLATDRRVPGGPAAAVIGFPLRRRERTIGALIALDSSASTEKAVSVGGIDGGVVCRPRGAIACARHADALSRVEALSVTDDLTSLYNSRYLNQVLHRESKRASRSGRPLSLLFLDLDGFKSVNDRSGICAEAGRSSKRRTSFAVRARDRRHRAIRRRRICVGAARHG